MALQDLAGIHVLVVEDTDDSRELFRMALEYCGALVTTAASAAEAKRILESLRPHVLVSDIGMPDDGLELIREVKAVAQTKGLADLVEKPLDPIALCGVVRRHVQFQT